MHFSFEKELSPRVLDDRELQSPSYASAASCGTWDVGIIDLGAMLFGNRYSQAHHLLRSREHT